MLSTRRKQRQKKDIPITEADIIAQELDVPRSLEPTWDIYRLRNREDHLWMAQLADPITMTAAAALYRYKVDFSFTLTRVSFYHTDADGVESVAPITLRADMLTPNRVQRINIYNEVAIIWRGGELTFIGARSSPVAGIEVVVSGTPGHLLHLNIQFEVHGIA